MKQQSLSGFEKSGKTTRRAQFLADMDRIIPWTELGAAVEKVYPKGSKGRSHDVSKNARSMDSGDAHPRRGAKGASRSALQRHPSNSSLTHGTARTQERLRTYF